ncbi:MAG: cold-shock protein [Bacteroidota bacterium]|jgi:cold shock CspA family protein
MGRSSETFNKKENERKKQKRRKDKAEKKEERKANSDKGKSLEDMMAYVDENGNLTNTPPDPKKKREIADADIQIGVFKRQELPEDLIRTGIVSFYNDAKGYGFIKDSANGNSIFVHANNLKQPIKDNNKVTFEVEKGPKGLTAVNVKLA